jgi:hypothetical protein
MEIDVIKPFIGHNVEILVAGVWIEGFLSPIAKGVIQLMPLDELKEFYGPCALKVEVVQAIRQIRRPATNAQSSPLDKDMTVRSGLDSVTPEQRFKR